MYFFFLAVYVTSKNISALSRRKGVNPIIIQRRIDKREVRRPTMEIKGIKNNLKLKFLNYLLLKSAFKQENTNVKRMKII